MSSYEFKSVGGNDPTGLDNTLNQMAGEGWEHYQTGPGMGEFRLGLTLFFRRPRPAMAIPSAQPAATGQPQQQPQHHQKGGGRR